MLRSFILSRAVIGFPASSDECTVAHICSAQIYFAVHKFIFQCPNISSHCKNIFLSAQIYFSVHKYISHCINKLSVYTYICSAQIYLQCTNTFASAQIQFSEGKLETNAAVIEAWSPLFPASFSSGHLW